MSFLFLSNHQLSLLGDNALFLQFTKMVFDVGLTMLMFRRTAICGVLFNLDRPTARDALSDMIGNF